MWKSLGPAVIGYGNILFGVALYAGTVTILKIWRDVLPVLVWVVLAGTAAYVVFSHLPVFDFWLFNAFIKGVIILIAYSGVYLTSINIRLTLNHFLRGVIKKRKIKDVQ
jgi:ABC-type transporter Mla maintaining outer membrane lipid asymmetry permease subunit MlaE